MANYTNIVYCTIPDVYDFELRKPLALLIFSAYGRLYLCAIAIYIAFKLLSTWNHRDLIAITLTLIDTNIERPNILSSERALT